MRLFITGMGRSGTKWLARELDKQEKWIVEHEPFKGPATIRQIKNKIGALPREQNYGIVCSHLRWQALAIWPHMSFTAVVLRDPIEIAQSIYNRLKPTDSFPHRHLQDSLRCLDGIIGAGVQTLSFTKMTTDPWYLNAQLSGVVKDQVDLSADNRSSRIRRMPDELMSLVQKKARWYIKEHATLF